MLKGTYAQIETVRYVQSRKWRKKYPIIIFKIRQFFLALAVKHLVIESFRRCICGSADKGSIHWGNKTTVGLDRLAQ